MMRNWKLIKEEKAAQIWNENLVKFEDCSPFQTFEWGQYQNSLGWTPLYFAHFDEEENITAMSMILLKSFPFKTGFVWVTGGPIGEIENWNEELPKAILKATKLKRLYFRFRCDRKRNTKDALLLEHHKWSKPLFAMASNFSMEFDLPKNFGDFNKKLSKSWKRNLKLALKNDLVIKQSVNPDITELREAFNEMEKNKNLPELFSGEKLENLFKYTRSNLIFFRCEDKEGNLLSVRGTLFIGKRAVDYLAVTTDEGRNLRASFPLLQEVFRHCSEKGITQYDLGGIDPWKNPGVYTFKSGTGAKELEYLGEWDWASSEWLRLLGNWAIQKRQTTKEIKSESSPKKESSSVDRFDVSPMQFLRHITGFFMSFIK